MWQAPHKEEQRSLQPGSARGYPSQQNYQGPKRPADTRRFGLDGALGAEKVLDWIEHKQRLDEKSQIQAASDHGRAIPD